MKRIDKARKHIKDGNTILGVGPMSWNCVDAVIELANFKEIPILLIASRRQIECLSLGGGYVTDTKTLAEYVRQKDRGNFVLLARDHGGPWEGNNEQNLSHDEALKTAMESYRCDIESGFDIVHIDPSIKSRPLNEIIDDVKYLYGECESVAKSLGKDVIYEAGTEEHGGQISDLRSFESFLEEIKLNCPKIEFVVGNTGTHVKEIENVGRFDVKRVKDLVSICNRYGFFLKEHNLDYVSERTLSLHPTLGIHSANVAPEFGVIETMTLCDILEEYGFEKELEQFLDIAYESKKWAKWMKSESSKQSSEYMHFCTIAGHYVFGDPRVKNMMTEVSQYLPLDALLKERISTQINKYLKNFQKK